MALVAPVMVPSDVKVSRTFDSCYLIYIYIKLKSRQSIGVHSI